jgi:anti-anti-sigma regulatory factor
MTIDRAGELLELLTRSLKQDGEVVADFSGVEVCDAAGLQLICSLRKTFAEHRRLLRVGALSPAIETAAANLGLAIQELAGGDSGGAGCGL